MSFHFKPAVREGVHLILGLMGGTGSGKTWSALELATGLAGGKPFAVIDTEAGRALQYADYFDFQHGDLASPFSPGAYLEAILAAEEARFPVVVVDSMSHEHAGDGGILDMHEAELDRIAGNDYKKRERVKFLAWVKPKAEHKRMVSRLLQLRTHLILCFRAEPKIKMVKIVKNGREVNEPVDVGWQPICAKGLEFEMAATWMLRNERPGEVTTEKIDEMEPTGQALKVPEPLKKILTGTHHLNRTHGEALAAWATGSGGDKKPEFIGDERAKKLSEWIVENLGPGFGWKSLDPERYAPIASLAELPEDEVARLRKLLRAAKKQAKTA